MRDIRIPRRSLGAAILLIAACLLPPVARAEGPAKYVFFFIGDGMGNAQVYAGEAYRAACEADREADEAPPRKLALRHLPTVGLATTFAANRFITDSAAAGTALACGKKTNVGVVAMSADGTTRYRTIAEAAHDAGRSVGIVSTVSLDHATPACFYAHSRKRSDYNAIALQLARSPFAYFGGGGLRGRGDGALAPLALARQNGMTHVTDLAALRQAPADARVLCTSGALAGASAMFYELDRAWLAEHGRTDAERSQMTLEDLTAQGIRLLADDPDGFFFMIEAGKIDWACHANDAAAAIHDTLALDRAVQQALAFQQAHPEDTLILVTADHETGGMTLGFAGTGYGSDVAALAGQRVSFDLFRGRMLAGYLTAYEKAHPGRRAAWDDAWDMDAEAQALIERAFGLEYAALRLDERTQLEAAYDRTMDTRVPDDPAQRRRQYLLYGRTAGRGRWGGKDPLTTTCTRVLGHRAGIAWTTYSHTAVPVPVFAGGAGAERFAGSYDNTDIATKLAAAMGVRLQPD